MFDYVIIDAPPLGVVIDAVIIGKYSDGALHRDRAGSDQTQGSPGCYQAA